MPWSTRLGVLFRDSQCHSCSRCWICDTGVSSNLWHSCHTPEGDIHHRWRREDRLSIIDEGVYPILGESYPSYIVMVFNGNNFCSY